MSAPPSSFRGIQGIREVKAKLRPLVRFYRKFKPEVTEVVCSRADYDLISRWPKAANAEGFLIGDNGDFLRRAAADVRHGAGQVREGATTRTGSDSMISITGIHHLTASLLCHAASVRCATEHSDEVFEQAVIE